MHKRQEKKTTTSANIQNKHHRSYWRPCVSRCVRFPDVSPLDAVLARWNHPYIGHRQDLLADGLAGGVFCCHGDCRRGLVHAQKLTWQDANIISQQKKDQYTIFLHHFPPFDVRLVVLCDSTSLRPSILLWFKGTKLINSFDSDAKLQIFL